MIDTDILPDKLFLQIFEKVNLFKISISHLLSDNSPAMDKLLVCFRPVLFHIFARTGQSPNVSRKPAAWSWILHFRFSEWPENSSRLGDVINFHFDCPS